MLAPNLFLIDYNAETCASSYLYALNVYRNMCSIAIAFGPKSNFNLYCS